MANKFGQSYGLTCLCPIKNGRCETGYDNAGDQAAYDKITRRRIQPPELIWILAKCEVSRDQAQMIQ